MKWLREIRKVGLRDWLWFIDQAIRAVPTQGGRGPASNPWVGTVGQSWGDIAIILSREKGGLFPKPGYATGQKAAVNQF